MLPLFMPTQANNLNGGGNKLLLEDLRERYGQRLVGMGGIWADTE
jgi:hypothetical protein